MTAPVASTPDTPLGPADFDAQDAQLDALREQGAPVPEWEFCEGFLAALVCCRREIPPEEYWPVLLGEGFQPMAHMEFVWRWMRRWKEVATALDAEVESLEDEGAYDPPLMDTRAAWLLLPEEQRSAYPFEQLPSVGELWASGFLCAVDAWADDWAPPRDKEAAFVLRDALESIARLARPEPGEPSVPVLAEDSPCSASEQRLDSLADALWAVYDLRSLWKSLGPRRPSVRKEPTPGRNDACPCGSGLKFKKCHGA